MSDVSTCLRDAMDSMFNNGHDTKITENDSMNFNINNNDQLLPTDISKQIINKRKFELSAIGHDEHYHQVNPMDSTKRQCTMNARH